MNQSDIVTATQPVVDTFETLGIPYYIGGSVASSAYGIARATMDVDMVADIKPQHVEGLVKRLETTYYIDANMILDAIKRKSSFNLIHLKTMLKIDIFILKDDRYHHNSLQRRRIDTLDEEQYSKEFYFVSAEDIILSKLDWYRMGSEVSERQWNDVLGVLKVQKHLLDIVYLKHWATELQLSNLLQKAFNEAGIETD